MADGRNIPENFFKFTPVVYVVEDKYCIIFNTIVNGMGWVEINGERYVSDRGGLIVSDKKVHKTFVPMEVLDNAKSYDVVFTPVYERKAYFATSGEPQRQTYTFRPVSPDKENINIYHISDTHATVKNPVAAASYFGDDLDLLVMNGDIPNHCGTIDQIMALYDVASQITKGAVPVVFSRGNHDTRGASAIYYHEYTPTTEQGNTYYTFKINNIWGIVLDCGEDKVDEHPEYGGMNYFIPFRKRETEFFRTVVENKEYEAEDIEYRLVICHIPIEIHWNEFQREIYTEWTELIEKINPDVILYAHEHKVEYREGNRDTAFGHLTAPVLVGGDPRGDNFKGLALTLNKEGYLAQFTDKTHTVLEEHKIPFAKR